MNWLRSLFRRPLPLTEAQRRERLGWQIVWSQVVNTTYGYRRLG